MKIEFSDKGTHAAWHLGGAVNLPGGVLDGASQILQCLTDVI